MFEMLSAGKRKRTTYQLVGEIKPPTDEGESSDYGQNPATFRFYWPATPQYNDVRYVRVFRRDGTRLTPGVDWVASASTEYSAAYAAIMVYDESASYWCSNYNTPNQWLQIQLTNPNEKLDRIEIFQPSYNSLAPIIRRLDGSTWVNVKTFDTPTFALATNYLMYFGDEDGKLSFNAAVAAGHNAFNSALRLPWVSAGGSPGGTARTYAYLNSFDSGFSGSVWGNWLADRLCNGSNVSSAIKQVLPELRHVTELNGKRILVETQGAGNLLSFRALNRNGVLSNDFGPYDGSECRSLVYFDTRFNWYVRASPWEMTVKSFDPVTEIAPWK